MAVIETVNRSPLSLDDPEPPDNAFNFWRRRIGLVAGPVVGLALYALLGNTDLADAARALAGILAFTVVYWICEPIPLAATALFAPFLCVLFGVADVKKVLQPFASPVIFLFLGSFILAQGVHRHGLDRRIAMRVLSWRWASRSPTTTLAVVGAVSAFLSMWMSNTATAALMLPVVLGLIQASPQLADRRVTSSLLLMISFGATAGGLATPIGTPPNLVGVGFIRELAHGDISFLQWMCFGVPLAVVLLAFLVLLLRPWGVPARRVQITGHAGGDYPDRSFGRLTRGEWNIVIVFGAALACWIYPGIAELVAGCQAPGAAWFVVHLPEEMIGLAAGLALFILPSDLRRWEFTVDWRDALAIDWGTIILFGGGMTLGQLIFSTGLANTVSDLAMKSLGMPGEWSLIAVAIVLSIALSELASNTASANVMLPLMIGLAQASHVPVIPVAIATSLASSFGFMLPVSTPPNAIVYGSGRVPLTKMIVTGVIFDVVGAVAIWCLMRIVAPIMR